MGLSLKNLGRKIFDQINPLDNGRTWQSDNIGLSPITNQQRAQQSINSANQQLQSQPARYGKFANPNTGTQALTDFANNQAQGNDVNPILALPRAIAHGTVEVAKGVPQTFGINSAVDLARYQTDRVNENIANLTHNKEAQKNARTAQDAAVARLANNVPNVLPIAIAEGVKPFAQSVASAALSPVNDYYANREADRAIKELSPTWGQNNAEIQAGNIKQFFDQSLLAKSGIAPTDSGGQISRKVGGQAAQAATNIALASELPGLEGSLARTVPTFGGLSAAQAAAGVAQMDNPTGQDYATQALQGGITGAALPVAFKGAGMTIRGLKETPGVLRDLRMAEQGSINPDTLPDGTPIDKSPAPSKKSPVSLPTPGAQTKNSAGKGTATPEEVAQYAHSFGITEEEATADLANIRARDTAVALRQQDQPNLGTVKPGAKEQLNPTEQLSQDERASIGKAENNPLLHDVGVPKATNAEEAHKNADYVSKQEQHVGSVAQTEVGELSAKDQALLTSKNIEKNGPEGLIKQSENPEQMKVALDALRSYYDTRHAWDQHFGINTPYRQNYLRDLVERNQGGPIPTSSEVRQPGYTEAKNQPQDTPVLDALNKDIRQGSYVHSQEAYARGIEEAYGADNISRGKPTVGKGGASQQLKTRYAGDSLFATPEVAKEINRRAPTDESNLAGRTYDKAIKVGKTATVGGNPFHGLTEAFRFVGQQVLSPTAWRHPIDTFKGHSRVVAGTFSERAAVKARAAYEADGTTQWSRIGGQTLNREEIAGDAASSWYDKAKRANPIRAIHESVFGREIPLQKQEIMRQAMKGATDFTNPENIAKARQVADATNHMFGGLNHETDALSPKGAQRLARISFSGDFTESKFRLVQDALTKSGPQGNIARQAVIGKSLATAAPGILALAAAGNIDWSNPKDVAEKIAGQILDPSLPTPFKTGSGIAKIARLPGTDVSELSRVIEPFFNGDANKLSGLEHYAVGHVNPVVGVGVKLATNQDYKGDPIIVHNSDAQGNDAGVNLRGTATNLFGSSLTSIGTNSLKVAQKKQSVGEALVNSAGLRTVADPNDPHMKAWNFQDNVVKGLPKDQQAAWNSVYGKNVDAQGNAVTVVPALDSQNNASTLLANPKVLEAGRKINDFKKAQGLPSDPFFELNNDQQKVVLNSAIDKFRNPAEKKVLRTQNPWLDQYNKDRSAYFDALNLPPSNKTKELPEPLAPDSAGQYFALTDPAQKSAYLADHPEITDYFNAHDQFIRAGRAKQNLPQYDKYPTADPTTQKLIDTYNALPKGDGPTKKDGTASSPSRSAWIKAHPNEWAQITAQYSKTAQYNLEQGAQQAAYQGQDFNASDIKDIKSLAQDLGVSSGGGSSGYTNYTPTDPTANPYKYSVSLKSSAVKAQGGSKSKSSGGGSKVTFKGSSKPKVSSKRSLV